MNFLSEVSQKFFIRAHGVPGLEKLKIFATTEDIPLLVEAPYGPVFRSVDSGERGIARDLSVETANIDANAWAEATAEFVLEITPD